MSRSRLARGRFAEALVATWLKERGFRILGKRVRVGPLELDLVAKRSSLLVFCEVRSAGENAPYHPVESIDRHKVTRLRRAASQWIRLNSPRTSEIRFDAAGVIFHAKHPPTVEYYADAF